MPKYETFHNVLFIVLYLTVCVLCALVTNCGFEKDELQDVNVTVTNPTKYKILIATPCTFRVDIKTQMAAGYEHYKTDLHQLAAVFGPGGSLKYLRGAYSTWDSLGVAIPCGACVNAGLSGMISVLDDRIDLIPWGCGKQRPPVIVDYVAASYIDPKGAVPVAKQNEVEWKDGEPPIYRYTYAPEAASKDEICDGHPVLFDLQPACRVLIDAGVLGLSN